MTETIKAGFDLDEPSNRGSRVCDAGQEAVAAILRREHVAGRIDSVEFDARLSRCSRPQQRGALRLAAKSYGELDSLIIDPPIEDRTRRSSGRASAWPFPHLSIVAVAIAAVVLTHGHLVWLGVAPFCLVVFRPRLWGRRLGSGCYPECRSRRRAYGSGCGP